MDFLDTDSQFWRWNSTRGVLYSLRIHVGEGIGRTANDHAPLALFSMERTNPLPAVCSLSIPKVYFSNTLRPDFTVSTFHRPFLEFSRAEHSPRSTFVYFPSLKTDCQNYFRGMSNENSCNLIITFQLTLGIILTVLTELWIRVYMTSKIHHYNIQIKVDKKKFLVRFHIIKNRGLREYPWTGRVYIWKYKS